LIASTLAVLAMGAIQVVGTTTCPSPAAVSQILGTFAADPAAKNTTAELSASAGNGLRIRLLDGSGQAIAERDLTPSADCTELAQAAAVMLHLWLAELETQPLEPIALEAEPPPAVAARSEASPPHEDRLALRLGVGPEVSLVSSGAALAGIVFADLIDRHGWLAGELSFGAQTQRPIDVSPGAADWSRWEFGLGALAWWNLGALALEAHVDGMLAILVANGTGFSVDHSASQLEPGLRGGVKLTTSRGQWRPWLGAWATWWPRSEHLTLNGMTSGPLIPQAELDLGIGASFDVF
jgi:hypothetical protein